MDTDFDTLLLDAERRAERLIAALRILTGVALLGVYGFVVNGRPPVEANSWILEQLVLARLTMVGYALLGVVAVVMSTERRHRRWHAYAFVTADALFVNASLYFALKNFGVSGTYISALANLWLVPLVLAFNTLRFSYFVQGYAAVVMMAGLVFVETRSGAGGTGLVPDQLFVSFVGPANIMRLAMIALASVVLTVAVVRTRQLLRTGLDQARRRALLTSYMPRQVARLIEETDNEELRAGQTMTVVVMFVDLRDFTARSETMPPERVSAFLSSFRTLLGEAVDDAGGIIDKFMGDGAMIVFAERARWRPAAERAVDCARDIVQRVAEWSQALVEAGRRPVRVGVGLHMGEAFVGAVGDEERLEFTVVGDVVNTAARMEEAAKFSDADIVASREVLAAAGVVDPAFVPISNLSVRGRRASVPAAAFTAHRPRAVAGGL